MKIACGLICTFQRINLIHGFHGSGKYRLLHQNISQAKFHGRETAKSDQRLLNRLTSKFVGNKEHETAGEIQT